MKNSVKLMMAVLALASLYACGEEAVRPPRVITVTGNAEVNVVPDEVVISVGVETNSKDLNLAKADNDERVKKILSLAVDFKIEPKNIQTGNITIEPRYRYNYEASEFVGYFVRKSVVITLKEIGKFESVLSALLNAGVTNIYGTDFRTTQLKKNKEQARSMAVKAARQKAEKMASDLGQDIGVPTAIMEDAGEAGPWYYGWGRDNNWVSQNAVQNAPSGGYSAYDGESTVALGQISIKARVTVTFALE